MKGFTGFYHYNHPCFIREEYEQAHINEDELQRIEDAIGISFSGVNTAMYYLLTHHKYLLYRCESEEIDNELLNGRDPWISYKDGYVHIVTGEYVPSNIRPTYDSYPCWRIKEPLGSYYNPSKYTSSLLLTAVIYLLKFLFGGKKQI